MSALSNIVLLNYNNYYNRKIKKEESLSDYLEYMVGDILRETNFIEGDGVDTSIVFNTMNDNADYLLVIKDNEISSRWFILDSYKLRNGQYKLTLKRDVLVDYYYETVNAPCFIRKGFVNKRNPLIFNNEGMKFNQIKTSETLLKDNSKCGWIVGYYDPKYPEQDDEFSGNSVIDDIPDISECPFTEYLGKTVRGNLINNKSSYTLNVVYSKNVQGYDVHNFKPVKMNLDGSKSVGYLQFDIPNELNLVSWFEVDTSLPKVLNQNYKIDNLYFYDMYESVSDNKLKEILLENEKIYKDKDKYIKIKVSPIEVITEKIDLTKNNYARTYDEILRIAKLNADKLGSDYLLQDGGHIMCDLSYKSIRVEYEYISNPVKNVKIKISKTANILRDAPYKMFCIPVNRKISDGNASFIMDKEFSIGVATSIANHLQPASGTGAGHLYDLQLLPYCPILDWFDYSTDSLLLLPSYKKEGINFNYVKDPTNTNILGIIFYPTKSSFTTNINFIKEVPSSDIQFKVERETSLYRLCSPNYSNFEDFDPYLNNGIDLINVDCTYKPITPYIKLNINYKNLYGKDFDDARGLICGGDYSLPIMSESFRLYEIQNKNYANIFDRETENLEVKHTWERAGTISSAITGAAAGAALGGATMKLGGGIAGGVLSAGGGIADIIANEKLYKENMSFREDIHNMQLDNIRAKPKGLVKTSAFNFNNKIFPFIEYYTSTETEKTALRENIIYNGMTINVIGKIQDYIDSSRETFIQGDIVRFTTLNSDYHIANTISEEIRKGVYF